MRTLVALLALVSLPVLADEKSWPQKGDVVYVSAEIRGMTWIPLFTSPRDIRIEPCDRMTIPQKPKESLMWVHHAPTNTSFRLCDGWRTVAHQKKSACLQASPVELIQDGKCFILSPSGN